MTSIRLDDPRLAAEITSLVDRRVAAAIAQAMPSLRYGIVAAVDTVNRRVSVRLGAALDASPGFVYPPALLPVVGDSVRVVIRGADRYVEAVLTGNGLAPEPPLIGRSVASNIPQTIASSAAARLVHQVVLWSDGITTYTVGSIRINVDGMYAITAHVEFPSNAAGAWRILAIGRNSGGHPTTWGGWGEPSNHAYAVSYPTRQTGTYRHHAAFLVPCVAGDWVASFGYQDIGANMDITTALMTAVRVGPIAPGTLLRGMLGNTFGEGGLPEQQPSIEEELEHHV